MEVFTVVLGLIGAYASFLAIKTYWESRHSKPLKEKRHLKVLFEANQKLNDELTVLITAHVEENNAWDKLCFENITFRSYINGLKKSRDETLSNELIQRVMDSPLSEFACADMIDSLKKQQESLILMKSQTLLLKR